MKRDMDLVRKILLELEGKNPKDDGLEPEQLSGHTPEEVGYHIGLLKEAGLVEAMDARSYGNPMNWIATRLTWEGHEFLEASRNEGVWTKAKQIAAEKGGGLTFEVLKQLLSKLLTDLMMGKS
jgi:hypothetical protein